MRNNALEQPETETLKNSHTPKRRNLIMAAIAKLAPESAIGKQYQAILERDKEAQKLVNRALDHLEYGPESDLDQQ